MSNTNPSSPSPSSGTPAWLAITLAIISLAGVISSALIAKGYFDKKSDADVAEKGNTQLRNLLAKTAGELTKAQEEKEKLRRDLASCHSGKPIETQDPPMEMPKPITLNGVKFEVRHCIVRADEAVECLVHSTALERDIPYFGIYSDYRSVQGATAASFIFVDGKQFAASEVSTAGTTGGAAPRIQAPKGEPVPTTLVFSGVNAQSSYLATLRLLVTMDTHPGFIVPFAKVPLSRP